MMSAADASGTALSRVMNPWPDGSWGNAVLLGIWQGRAFCQYKGYHPLYCVGGACPCQAISTHLPVWSPIPPPHPYFLLPFPSQRPGRWPCNSSCCHSSGGPYGRQTDEGTEGHGGSGSGSAKSHEYVCCLYHSMIEVLYILSGP